MTIQEAVKIVNRDDCNNRIRRNPRTGYYWHNKVELRASQIIAWAEMIVRHNKENHEKNRPPSTRTYHHATTAETKTLNG